MRPSKLLSSNSLIKVISILNDAADAAFSQQPSDVASIFINKLVSKVLNGTIVNVSNITLTTAFK